MIPQFFDFSESRDGVDPRGWVWILLGGCGPTIPQLEENWGKMGYELWEMGKR